MSPEQIAETLATLNQALSECRPTVSTSSCTAPNCAACKKGGVR
ncbi:hypothetical protein [Streptosporangium sp. NPDC006007]